MVYQQICAGVSRKTKVSFISSNSSFTECVRKHSSSQIFNSQSCTISPYTNCTFAQTSRPTISSSATFTSCTFTSLSSNPGNGGAISFQNQASGTLTVISCNFYSCKCTATGSIEDGGGAIFAHTVSKVEVSSSLFVSSACYSTSEGDG